MQKQGIRAIMLGYVNYWYKDGNLSAHTKKNFQEYNILTMQGIIVMNALMFIHKVRHFPNSSPPSHSSTSYN